MNTPRTESAQTALHADVLVVGGGFAGFWAALAARRVLGCGKAVMLVSAGPVLQLRPRLYESQPHAMGIDLAPLLDRCGVDFAQAVAHRIDAHRRTVHLADGRTIAFERLVLATGSAMARPPMYGAETAASIDTLADAIDFDRRLAHLARHADAPVLAVIGAGFTGIELVLELRDRIAEHGGSATAERARLLLIDRSGVVGAELGPGPRAAIEAALDAARVERLLGASVERIEPRRLHLRVRAPIEVDACVLATGMRAAPLAQALPGTHDPLGRVVVDGALRAPAAPMVFVAGDAAAADTGAGRISLQSCQHALLMGRFAGENAGRDLLGEPLLRYAHERYVTCLDLGRSGAVFSVGWERRPRLTGVAAKDVKRHINTEAIVPPVAASGEALLALSRIDAAPDAG